MYKIPVMKKIPECTIIPKVKGTRLCGVYTENYVMMKLELFGNMVEVPAFTFEAGISDDVVSVMGLKLKKTIDHLSKGVKELYCITILKEIEGWAKESAEIKLLIIKTSDEHFIEPLNELSFKDFNIYNDGYERRLISAKKRYTK